MHCNRPTFTHALRGPIPESGGPLAWTTSSQVKPFGQVEEAMQSCVQYACDPSKAMQVSLSQLNCTLSWIAVPPSIGIGIKLGMFGLFQVQQCPTSES
jgi:hypothetical protein